MLWEKNLMAFVRVYSLDIICISIDWGCKDNNIGSFYINRNAEEFVLENKSLIFRFNWQAISLETQTVGLFLTYLRVYCLFSINLNNNNYIERFGSASWEARCWHMHLLSWEISVLFLNYSYMISALYRFLCTWIYK